MGTAEIHHLLTLRNIAAWQIQGIQNSGSAITARVPSLQRGAVWEPQQIELLWDSVFRGFPIGSIVVIKKIDGQRDKSRATHAKDVVEKNQDIETTHHILDGQQRCNAIAWGFADPWQEGMSNDAVLWLDFQPSDLLKNTTRKYLFRLTTKAHPWGFLHGNEAGNLSHEQRGKFQEKVDSLYAKISLPPNFKSKLDAQDVNKRPLPSLTLPFDANFPVPTFLLFKHFRENNLDWDALAQEEWVKIVEIWSGIHISELKDEDRKNVESGLRMAEQTRLIALLVPDALKGIDNIEQIFQRLNRQGTPLDNEELVYSMIKAYWPKIEDVMSKLQTPPITEVRLVNLGVRIALTEMDSKKLAPELTVDGIRKIFSPSGERSAKDIKDQQTIKDYFENPDKFQNALNWIDDNFLYDKKIRPYGLPAYLRSSIAWSSREVFAWLMLLARQHEYKPIGNAKNIIGLALAIHWFGVEKAKSADKLISKSDFSSVTISDINDTGEKKLILVPLNIDELKAAFQLDETSGAEQLNKWTSFWQGIVVRDKNGIAIPENEAIERKENCGLFIDKLRQLQELLVYAQREYIESVFEGFDPANKLMWKGHNRPWDYDHILPSQKLNAQGRGTRTYTAVCQAWQQSIGNQVAVDFSFNRKAQDKMNPAEKYAGKNIFADNEALKCLAIDLDKTEDQVLSKQFVLAAKDRLIEMYQEWYLELNIDQYRK